jgi:hypothetical protein
MKQIKLIIGASLAIFCASIFLISCNKDKINTANSSALKNANLAVERYVNMIQEKKKNGESVIFLIGNQQIQNPDKKWLEDHFLNEITDRGPHGVKEEIWFEITPRMSLLEATVDLFLSGSSTPALTLDIPTFMYSGNTYVSAILSDGDGLCYDHGTATVEKTSGHIDGYINDIIVIRSNQISACESARSKTNQYVPILSNFSFYFTFSIFTSAETGAFCPCP